MTDNCDAIGLIEVDLGLMSSDLGARVTEAHLAEFYGRIQKVSENRYFLPKFIPFQYGELSEKCPPHKTVLRLIELHKLTRDGLHYSHPCGCQLVPALTAVESKVEVVQSSENSALEIYDAYPKKLGRKDALIAISKALKKIDGKKLLEITKKYAEARLNQDSQFTPYPATWFNAEHFFDDPAMWIPTNNGSITPKPSSRFPMTPDGDYDFDRMTEKQRSAAVREMNR